MLNLFILCFISPFFVLASISQKPVLFSQMKTIKAGDSIYSILKKQNFSTQDINNFITHKDIPKKIKLMPGDFYKISLDSNYKSIKFYDQKKDVSYNIWRKGNQKGIALIKENYTKKLKSAKGKVQGSIIESLQKKTNNKDISYRFLDAYAFKYNLKKELKRNAFFSILYEEKYDGKHYIKAGEVLKTQIEINGKIKTRQFISYKNGGSFLGEDLFTKNRPFYSPVNYLKISSNFNPKRFHPIKKRRIPHHGVDFELESGAPVFTAQEGLVFKIGRNRAAGNYIAVRHKNGFETYYNHLKSTQKTLKVGAHVINGQKIGEIGCTGYCTKTHLHFALKKKGRYLNPMKYLKTYPFSKEKLFLAKNKKNSLLL